MNFINNKDNKKNPVAIELQMSIMNYEDFKIVRTWCIQEGWNLGLYDASIYFKTDQDGHFLFFDKKKPVGSISLVKHDDHLFTLGPYIVDREYRGQGYGAVIWEKAMARLDSYPDARVLLYAIDAQMRRYQKEGFNPLYKNHRWNLNPQHHLLSKPKMPCSPLTLELIAKITEYDKIIFTASREKTIQEALTYPEIKGFVIQKDNCITAFGLIRPCLKGYRVGPLFADTQEMAHSLLVNLLKQAGSENVLIDMPNRNKEGEALMIEFNATRDEQHDTIAMVKGTLVPEYERNLRKNYGIFSLEIG
jgi:GNAT superfamily N-acetyltransferase